MGFIEVLGIEFTVQEKDRVVGTMPITPDVLQPFGFVHGGATLALLESVASLGATLNTNLETELPFGVDVQVRHRKSGKEGMVTGEATFEREEPSSTAGVKQFWHVVATDDAGDIMSEGTIMMKIVPKDYLRQKAQQKANQES